jgi:hypothetical protein
VFAGAYAITPEGTVGWVALETGGRLHVLRRTLLPTGAFDFTEVTDPELVLGSTAPDIIARLAGVGEYVAGFVVTDCAGNSDSSFASVDVLCDSDFQCIGQPTGAACDVATGNCVECTATNASACGGATPVCEEAWNACVECTALNMTYCDVTLPYCVMDACAQCLDWTDCGDGSGLYYYICNSSYMCDYCSGTTPCPSGLTCDTPSGLCY